MSITTFPCPIPKITNEMEKHWSQPDRREIQFTTDGFAVVSDAGLAQLQRYDTSYPSGVYAGKMWMRTECNVEYLCWWIDSPDAPEKCELRFRKILHKRVMDLLTQANDPDSPDL